MADYAAKPTKAKEDVGIIELRKRMLAVFLNRCRRMPRVRDDGVWWRFLDPNASWVGSQIPWKAAYLTFNIIRHCRTKLSILLPSQLFRNQF